ncbi:hypothetical protein D6825_00295 [Candidatus Woesearchaeota archaeon]|nr:MAG: hypothetical protein D6825_00295 [Candidatus Woesearchaeota archaeon]
MYKNAKLYVESFDELVGAGKAKQTIYVREGSRIEKLLSRGDFVREELADKLRKAYEESRAYLEVKYQKRQ